MYLHDIYSARLLYDLEESSRAWPRSQHRAAWARLQERAWQARGRAIVAWLLARLREIAPIGDPALVAARLSPDGGEQRRFARLPVEAMVAQSRERLDARAMTGGEPAERLDRDRPA